MNSIFKLLLVSSLQHELLHPQQHGEDALGVRQAMVGKGLHQAGVHHTEGVCKALSVCKWLEQIIMIIFRPLKPS